MRLRLAPLALLMFALPAAADDRYLWKYDGGSYEKVGDNKWVEKKGDETFELSELSGSDTEVKLNDRKRKMKVTLKAGVAIIYEEGQKQREVKGDWVVSDKPAVQRVLWKHDKGTYEKADVGKWVEKSGSDTFEFRESESTPDWVELFDLKRGLRVKLQAGSATVTDGKKKETRELKGDWVAAKADPKTDPKAAPAAERVLWKHDKGQFEKTGAGKWVETVSARKVEWAEKAATDEYVELYDAAGKRTVRLAAKEASTKPDNEVRYRAWTAGGWVAKEVDPKLPKPSAHFAELASLKPDIHTSRLAFSPDGKFVARVTGELGTPEFAVVEIATGKAVQKWPAGMYVNTAVWSADGKTLAGAVDHMGLKGRARVVLWDTAKWQEKGSLDLTVQGGALAISGDAGVVAVGGAEFAINSMTVWDVAKKKAVATVPVDFKKPPAVALSTDGKVLAVSRHGKDADEVAVYDLPAGKLRGAVKGGPAFALAPDGGTLVAWTADEKAGSVLSVWDAKALAKAPRTIKEEKWAAGGVAFGDGKLVVGVAEVNPKERPPGVRVYDLKTLEVADAFTFGKPQKGDPGPRVWLTPDASRLLTQTDERVLTLWGTPFSKGKPDAPPKGKAPGGG